MYLYKNKFLNREEIPHNFNYEKTSLFPARIFCNLLLGEIIKYWTHQTFWQPWQLDPLGGSILEVYLDHETSCFYGLLTTDPAHTDCWGGGRGGGRAIGRHFCGIVKFSKIFSLYFNKTMPRFIKLNNVFAIGFFHIKRTHLGVNWWFATKTPVGVSYIP